MGHWGVRSYEIDEAADAIDAAFERVHGRRYESLMDDRNPMSVDQIHQALVSPTTLSVVVDVLKEEFGADLNTWDETARLAFAGVVVRHAELGVDIPPEIRDRAIAWLETEDIGWDEAPKRLRRLQAEIDSLRRGDRNGK